MTGKRPDLGTGLPVGQAGMTVENGLFFLWSRGSGGAGCAVCVFVFKCESVSCSLSVSWEEEGEQFPLSKSITGACAVLTSRWVCKSLSTLAVCPVGIR